jgi:hypothetical protein
MGALTTYMPNSNTRTQTAFASVRAIGCRGITAAYDCLTVAHSPTGSRQRLCHVILPCVFNLIKTNPME